MAETLRDMLPPIYAPLLPALFDRPAIAETRATCGDCAMCDRSGGTTAPLDVAFFRPDVKCCSYHPTLPNYLVGAALSDGALELEAGRRRLRDKIARRIGVTPTWLAAPRKYLVLLGASRESSFGRSGALLCPYFDAATAGCSIWRHRESVCATFFCKHVGGAGGHAFWTGLRRYMEHVERALASHVAAAIASDVTEPSTPRSRLTREDLEDRPPEDDEYRRYWGAWTGREEAFYVACAERVRSMTTEEYGRVVDDAGGRALAEGAAALLEAVTQPTLAPRLVLNPRMTVVPAPGGVAVTTYSRYDSLFLTQDLHDALATFDGTETVDAVLERLRRDHDVDLPRELLLELQVTGVMTPPDQAPTDTTE